MPPSPIYLVPQEYFIIAGHDAIIRTLITYDDVPENVPSAAYIPRRKASQCVIRVVIIDARISRSQDLSLSRVRAATRLLARA